MPHITSAERIGIEKGLEEGLLKGLEEGLLKGLEEGLLKGLEKGLEKGRHEGRHEGRQEGRQEGQTLLIIRMLKRRWGTLPSELEIRLSRLSLAQLESLGETLLDFHDPSDLHRWLDEA